MLGMAAVAELSMVYAEWHEFDWQGFIIWILIGLVNAWAIYTLKKFYDVGYPFMKQPSEPYSTVEEDFQQQKIDREIEGSI